MNKIELVDNQKRCSKKVKSMLGSYIDNCLYIIECVLFADVALRLFKGVREFFFYEIYYLPEQRLWHTFKRVYSYNQGSRVLMLAVAAAILIRSHITKQLILVPPVKFLAYIPLYWLFCSVYFSHSTIDYAYWIRENHGLDYAAGMASNYFHGYLKLTLPSYTAHPGIRERIELYEATHHVKFAINRLVILVPNAMFVNSKIESKIMDRASPLEPIMKNRAGVERPFKNDVYRFNVPIENTHYYVALEGATPMLSFFEAMNFELSSTWQMKEMQREILFKFYKHLKKLLNEWPETQQEVELVLYNSYTADGRPQDVGEVLYEHLKNLKNEGRI